MDPTISNAKILLHQTTVSVFATKCSKRWIPEVTDKYYDTRPTTHTKKIKHSGENTKNWTKLCTTHIQRAIMTCNHCSHDTKATQQ